MRGTYVALTLTLVASLAWAGGADDEAWSAQVAPPDAGWRRVFLERDGGCPSGPDYSCVCAYRVVKRDEGCVAEVCETSAYRTWSRPPTGRGKGITVGGVVGDSLCRDDVRRTRLGPDAAVVTCGIRVECDPGSAGGSASPGR